jgi:hypothetical protein
MSVEYNAAIVVGAAWEDINEDAIDNIDELVESGDLHDFPPFYDGYREGLFGLYIVNSPDYGYCEMEYTAQDVGAAKQKFKELTGIEGKVYLTTIGS